MPEDLAFTNASLRGAGAPAKRAALNLQMQASLMPQPGSSRTRSTSLLPMSSALGRFSHRRLRGSPCRDSSSKQATCAAVRRHGDRCGLQLDLVDAIASPAVYATASRLLCTLRVALAITPTYWDEQVPRRSQHGSVRGAVACSVSTCPLRDTEELAPLLIGKYLNAARLGIANIERGNADRFDRERCDSCPFDRRDECHAIFGATSEGHVAVPAHTLRPRRPRHD